MNDLSFITERIPHRPPFLLVDKVVALEGEEIRAEKTFDRSMEVFQGHYPEYPLVPGVLLCEALFQAGALLISTLTGDSGANGNGVPVLTRILGAKFKREVRPDDTVELSVTLKEKVGPAWFLKGTARIRGKVAVQVEFACTEKDR